MFASPRAFPCAVALLAALTGSLAALPARAQEAETPRESVQVDLEEPGTALRGVVNYHNGRAWWYGVRTVCVAPCTATVPIDGTYQVVGTNMPESALFSLPSNREDVELEVHRGNKSAHDGATFFAIAGGLLAGVGVVFLVGELASSSPKLSDSDTTTGLVLSGLGVGALAVAIPLLITNATTVRFR
jgi:hypothetical protein